MRQIVKHGIYTHKRECPYCKCVFTYFDDYDNSNDVKYVWGYGEGEEHSWNNFRFLYKEIVCPECGKTIKVKEKKDDSTLTTVVDGTRLTL